MAKMGIAKGISGNQRKRASNMDAWDMFCYLCKVVVESQDVCLDVFITENGIKMMLVPADEYYGEAK